MSDEEFERLVNKYGFPYFDGGYLPYVEPEEEQPEIKIILTDNTGDEQIGIGDS